MQKFTTYAHYPGIFVSFTLDLSSLKTGTSITVLEQHLKYSTQ